MVREVLKGASLAAYLKGLIQVEDENVNEGADESTTQSNSDSPDEGAVTPDPTAEALALLASLVTAVEASLGAKIDALAAAVLTSSAAEIEAAVENIETPPSDVASLFEN